MFQAGRFVDPELANGFSKPNGHRDFLPILGMNLFTACGSGPYCLSPYRNNGVLPKLNLNGNAKLAPKLYGWAEHGTATESADMWFCDGTDITWAPPQAGGTFFITFLATRDANTGAATNRRCYFFYGDKTTGAGNTSFSLLTTLGGNFIVGWANSGTTGRVSASLATGAPGSTPLWLAGDLVAIFIIYDAVSLTGGAPKQAAYIATPSKGLYLMGTGTGGPGIFTGANARVGIGGGDGSGNNRGNDEPIFQVGFCSVALSFRNIAAAIQNPFTWMFKANPFFSSAFAFDPDLLSGPRLVMDC